MQVKYFEIHGLLVSALDIERALLLRTRFWEGALRRSFSTIPGLLVLVSLSPFASAQPAASTAAECTEAKIIQMRGQWVANPGTRLLKNWSCVVGGDQLRLDDHESSGEITVIYHSGSKPPHTVRCPSRAECRNAYEVERVVDSGGANSTWGPLLDFFFSKSKPKPVPGILQGSLPEQWMIPPTSQPRHPVVCSDGGTVDFSHTVKFANFVNQHKLAVRMLDEHDQVVEAQFKDLKIHGLFPEDGGRQAEVVLLSLDSDPNPKDGMLVLVASRPACEPLTESYGLAVNFTQTWPKTVSREARWNFRSAYLGALAFQPDEAPQPKQHSLPRQ